MRRIDCEEITYLEQVANHLNHLALMAGTHAMQEDAIWLLLVKASRRKWNERATKGDLLMDGMVTTSMCLQCHKFSILFELIK